jgi:D-glycero-alpha-D-manno-heptose-7-phosphate kinase
VPARIDFAGGWSDVPDFSAQEGGAVLNAAIDLYTEGHARWTAGGLSLSYRLDVPPDSHLGTSSSTNMAWVELIAALTGKTLTAEQRAEQTFAIERAMGEKGGKQDQYAAALGGFNMLRFAGESDPVCVTPIHLDPKLEGDLAGRCLFCHAGAAPDSGDLHKQVWQRFAAGDADIRDVLRAIRDSVVPARTALERGDWAALADQMNRNRELADALGGGSVTPRMDALWQTGRAAGALGAKGGGAGGGGYMLFLCGDGGTDAVEQALTDTGADVRRFGFAPRRQAGEIKKSQEG